jgi:thiamine kinase-like enzyme
MPRIWIERVKILAEYEAKIHAVKKNDPVLYLRRIRDLIGRGDCITGIIDSYPRDERTFAFTSDDEFMRIERKCIEWRWKLRDKTKRLCQVHGDMHPFNILWQNKKFMLLDRSRGEWGEAADDVSCLSINYIFWSLMTSKYFKEPFRLLFETFIKRYIELTKDDAIFKIIQPFYAFRSLVIAHPFFYPNITVDCRRQIFNFMNSILDTDEFDFRQVNSYIKG